MQLLRGMPWLSRVLRFASALTAHPPTLGASTTASVTIAKLTAPLRATDAAASIAAFSTSAAVTPTSVPALHTATSGPASCATADDAS